VRFIQTGIGSMVSLSPDPLNLEPLREFGAADSARDEINEPSNRADQRGLQVDVAVHRSENPPPAGGRIGLAQRSANAGLPVLALGTVGQWVSPTTAGLTACHTSTNGYRSPVRGDAPLPRPAGSPWCRDQVVDQDAQATAWCRPEGRYLGGQVVDPVQTLDHDPPPPVGRRPIPATTSKGVVDPLDKDSAGREPGPDGRPQPPNQMRCVTRYSIRVEAGPGLPRAPPAAKAPGTKLNIRTWPDLIAASLRWRGAPPPGR